MNVDDMIIVSIDDHLIEPPNLFDDHLPDRYREQAPRLVRNAEGKDAWIFEDQIMGMVGGQATVGALRAQSPDVDTSIVSREDRRARYEANPPHVVASV